MTIALSLPMALLALAACVQVAGAGEVINAGVGGNTTKALLRRVDKDVVAKAPLLVVMMAGTNDGLNSGTLATPDEFRRNLEALCDAIRAKSALLLVLPPPFHEPDLLSRHKAEAYGDLPPARRMAEVRRITREVAEARGIPVVDLEPVFAGGRGPGEGAASYIRNQANSGKRDGVHLTSDGYRAVAEAVAAAIRTHRLPAARVVCFGDSLTLGAGAGPGGSYPERLKTLLGTTP